MYRIKVRLHNQQGSVLVLVLILMTVLAIFATAAYEVATNNQHMLAVASASDSAFFNAEQGLNKYLWQINSDPRFYTDTTAFSLVAAGESNYNVYQRKSDEEGSYRVQIWVPLQEGVEVNNRALIRATGWDADNPGRVRSIEAEIVKRTFTQYGMITNGERNEDGDINYWVNNEKFYGPLHTNDTLYIGSYNPIFYGPVSYSKGINPSSRREDSSVFRQGTSQADALVFPPSNDKLMAQARIGGAGHYYSGRACIMLKGSSYDIRYYDNVNKTWMYNGHPYTYTPNSSYFSYDDRRKEIGTYILYPDEPSKKRTFSSFAALRAAVSSLALPDNGVIYVNGRTGDNGNGGLTYEFKFDPEYGNVFVSGELDGELTIAAANDIYITAYDPVDWRYPSSTYRVTANYTDGLTYTNTDFTQNMDGTDWLGTTVTGAGDDMLGLVASRRVQILHYNWPSQENSTSNYSSLYYSWGGSGSGNAGDGNPIDVAARYQDITIHAAIYAKDLIFGFEHPKVGSDKGEINLVGSIAQAFRGTVGTTGGTGYTKNYCHDPRMLYQSPPHYIEPANTGWQTMKWREISDHITSNPE